ncbi:MAG: GNAT family N-acetyltransferase [Magnetococcus sp. YQC-9]
MTGLAWREEAISKRHQRKTFDCGQMEMNIFLSRYARQAHESGASKTYVAVDPAGGEKILGFYTLTPTEIEFSLMPPEVRPVGSGRYPVAGFRLARLAVDKSVQGRGLGGALLISAARRAIRASLEVGGTMLVMDAKDSYAADWYKNYGAIEIPARPLLLVLSYKVFLAVMQAAGRPII